MPVAAIESLVSLLASTPSLSTISETLDLLATSVATLKRSIANPISLSAGTDLFQRYLITTLQRPNAPSPNDFATIRSHLLTNSRLFVARAKDARRAIASTARRFVRPGSTVLTNGGSRVVGAVLRAAAESQTRETGAPRFKVVWVVGASYHSAQGGEGDGEGKSTIAALRALHVPVATISEAATAYSMGKVSMALVGAEGVVETGGCISRMGTYQVGVLAKAAGKPLYVVAESHKFVRMFPLNQYDLGVEQNVLNFSTVDSQTTNNPLGIDVLTPKADRGHSRVSSDAGMPWGETTPLIKNPPEYFNLGVDSGNIKQGLSASAATVVGPETNQGVLDSVDYTPPDLITALVTEAGVLTPSAVSEELIKIWY